MLRYEETLTPESDDVATVREALRSYNRQHAGDHPRQELAVFARDASGAIVGGATGETHWGWLHVELLWVDDDHRGEGLGAQLLSRIENLADTFGVIGYRLGTTSFQALAFYRRCGYEVWGELPDMPPGHTNYSLRKNAAGRPRADRDLKNKIGATGGTTDK